MNQVNVLLGYDPRCTFYPKATPNGVVYYYLRYYLPGNIRVSRSVGQNKKEAKRLMFEKTRVLKKESLMTSIFKGFLIQSQIS